MAGRRKQQLPPNDKSLTPVFWERFGKGDEPSVRDKILFLSMLEIGRAGPSEFNGVTLCHRLNVSPSLINHYFDGRDGLIAEATAMAYLRYVDRLADAVFAHESDPERALRAWLYEQVAWSEENPGLGAILNYSAAFGVVNDLIRRDFQREITRAFEFNMYLLVSVIQATRDGSALHAVRSVADFDRDKVVSEKNDLMLASSFAWSVLGAAVWFSGQHTPSHGTEETRQIARELLDLHADRLIESIRVKP